MVRNLSTTERVIRLVAAAMVLGLYGALPSPLRYLALAGLIPLGTGLRGQSPVYHAIGRMHPDDSSPARLGDTRPARR